MIQFSRTCTSWVSIGLLLMVSACAASTEISRTSDPRLVDLSHVRGHVEALNTSDLEGRETGLLGGVRAAAYVAGVLRSNALQPVREDEYRWLYPLRKNVLEHAGLHMVDADTVRLIPGTAFLVDRRSGSGSWAGTMQRGQRPIDILGRGVQLDSVGTRPGPLTSGDAPMRIGLLPPAYFWLDRPAVRGGSIQARIQVSEQVVSGLHVIGILTGAHPLRRDSVVVVMARYDGSGVQGAGTWTNGTDSGLDAAVLLETARMLSVSQDLDRSVPFSVLFAFVSGVEEGCQGMDWLEQYLPWDRDAVLEVIVLGQLEACTHESWFEQNGLLMSVPAPTGWWSSGIQSPAGTPELVRREDLLTRARLAAIMLAASTWINETTRAITNTP